MVRIIFFEIFRLIYLIACQQIFYYINKVDTQGTSTKIIWIQINLSYNAASVVEATWTGAAQ